MPYKTKKPDAAGNGSGFQNRFHTQKFTPIDRDTLPAPLNYFKSRELLKGAVRGEWVSITCPAHAGGAEKHPSLRVNLVDGHFACMACGVRGGDLIALHRLIAGVSFPQALADLGVR